MSRDDPDVFERRLDRDVHVWRASTDVEPGRLRALCSTLSTDEHERAERLRFPRDRQRFIARRGLLRAILAKYVEADPHELRFSYGRFGKPAVASGPEPSAVEFSLSHSAGLALLAVTKREGIGIDVERIDANLDYRAVAASFFVAQESEALERTPAARARRIFFELWSLREAVGKARGDGLAVLEQRQADAAAGTLAPMWGCTATALDVADGYAAALALRGSWTLQLRPWHGRVDGWEACCRVGVETC